MTVGDFDALLEAYRLWKLAEADARAFNSSANEINSERDARQHLKDTFDNYVIGLRA